MTTKQIEEVATNAVKNVFNYTDKLSSYISDNDKEPSWDGFVYI